MTAVCNFEVGVMLVQLNVWHVDGAK